MVKYKTQTNNWNAQSKNKNRFIAKYDTYEDSHIGYNKLKDFGRQIMELFGKDLPNVHKKNSADTSLRNFRQQNSQVQ